MDEPRKGNGMTWRIFAAVLLVALAAGGLTADDRPPAEKEAAQAEKGGGEAAATDVGPGEPQGLTRMTKDYDIWIDPKRKAVIVDGQICLREGQLEMFACPKGSKEHESVIAVNAKPQFVHAALLAVGAKSGTPVKFDPE